MSGSVSGGAGDDIFNISAAITATLNGGSDNDQFNIDAGGISAHIVGGDTDNDSIRAHGDVLNPNTWVTSAVNEGSVTNAGIAVIFTGIENLQGGSETDTFTIDHEFDTVSGGAGVDSFTINANVIGGVNGNDDVDTFNLAIGSITGNVDGGNDNDIFNIQVANTTATLIGGGGDQDTVNLNNPDGDNEWVLLTADSGTVDTTLSFSEMEVLNGADGLDSDPTVNDLFQFDFDGNFGGTNGRIDARGGSNDSVLVTVAGISDIVLGESIRGVVSAEALLNNSIDGTGFFIEVSSDASHANSTTTWEIKDVDAGDLSDGVNDGSVSRGNDSINFINFAGVVGNQADDNFTVLQGGSIASVDGGTGTNELSVTSGPNTWTLTGLHAGQINAPATTCRGWYSPFSNLDIQISSPATSL